MRRVTTFLLVLAIPGLAACGAGSASHPAAPGAKLVHVRGSAVPSIVLSPLGTQRIGIRTARALAAGHGVEAIPLAAVVYEADGTSIVYTNPQRNLYTRMRISIATIAGDRVYASRGPAPGTRVVIVGAEELLGA